LGKISENETERDGKTVRFICRTIGIGLQRINTQGQVEKNIKKKDRQTNKKRENTLRKKR